jgi:hypothetical protein
MPKNLPRHGFKNGMSMEKIWRKDFIIVGEI